MTCPSRLAASSVLAASLICWCVLPARAGAWRLLERIPTEYPAQVADFVLDSQGTPWVAAGRDVWWFNGREWTPIAEGHSRYPVGRCFCGGPDREAYLGIHGQVFKLAAGRAHPVAPLPVKPAGDYPRLYVSRSGELFCCAAEFIAVLKEGAWKKVDAKLGITQYSGEIIDFGPDGPIVFLSRKVPQAVIYDDETFDTDVPLPELKVDAWGNVRAGRWGRNRILFWRVKSQLLGAAELVGHRFQPVDVAGLAEQIGQPKWVYIADTAPDGSLWLRVGRRKLDGPNLVRIGKDGKVTKHLGQFIKWGSEPSARYYDHTVLHARDGTFWFAAHKKGMSCIRDGQVELHDWHRGVLAPDVRHLVEAPDGTLYAATASAAHQVYRWDPQATPDGSLTEHWEEVVHVISRKCVADFSGNLWACRLDRPGKASRWDGSGWRDFDIPFDADKVKSILADDCGHLIVEMHAHASPRGTYVVGEGEPVRYETLQEALVACVQAGARRFRTPSPEIVPPIVTDDKRIWIALSPYYMERDLLLWNGGEWRKMDLPGVKAMDLDEQKRPVFVTTTAMWAYRSGEFVKLADVPDQRTRCEYLVKGEFARNGRVPFVPGMPKSLRGRYTVMKHVDSHYYRPVRWQETRPTAGVHPTAETSDARQQKLADPGESTPAPGGGAWIRTSNGTTWRWLDELLVKLHPENTPLVDRQWEHVGVTTSGGVWVITGGYHGGTRIFLRKADPERVPPRVRISKFELKYGRRVCVTWELPKEGAVAAVWRTTPDDRWRVLEEPNYERLFTEPGRHQFRLEARAMDELGLLGPPTIQTVQIDVRLPRTRWTAELPKCLEDLVWVVPVDADWTAADGPRRIEWRLAGGEWRVLPDNRRIPVAVYNNRAVEFQFRAVEEDVFLDPEPLSIKVAVEMPLEEVIRRRIELLLTGTEAERKQAVEDLKAAPEEARKLLREKLASLIHAEDICRQALTEIQ